MESPIELLLHVWDRVLRALKSCLSYAFYWLFTVKIPVPGVIGVPALLWALAKQEYLRYEFLELLDGFVNGAQVFASRDRLLCEFIGGVQVLGDWMGGLVALMRVLHLVLRDVWLTEELVDSPFLLWAVRFWRGFFRGLGAFGARYIREYMSRVGLDDDEEEDCSGSGSESDTNTDTDTDTDTGTGTKLGSDDGYQGETPRPIGHELSFWPVYTLRTILVLFLSAAALVSAYVLCKYLVTALFIGGGGCRRRGICLQFYDIAILEASRVGKKPIDYRFFDDGTRMQFPKR
ncbi:hypothetical protein F5B22DRAFT_644555 [Xylaria bambusicola]|uniref:uncharacterized protein n=1 Tax=Xylaria bambusicola TaxID=326684 RepID=UPI002007EF4C|nr:uncharacterized protein F5B22DRAFT_644555 [Xylaria bambusicola]KAI0520810.1 hypothetical protein F5B22DRAFT_644555 [Xylaria bambusicola]